MKRNIQDMTEQQRRNRLYLATATDEQLSDFITRNALEGVLSFNSKTAWIKGQVYGDFFGADRCEVINTKKNTKRGNWYVTRL